jgi:hypothetical protein
LVRVQSLHSPTHHHPHPHPQPRDERGGEIGFDNLAASVETIS